MVNSPGERSGGYTDGPNWKFFIPAIKGYQIWADALRPIFTDVLGPPAEEDNAPPPTGNPAAQMSVSPLGPSGNR